MVSIAALRGPSLLGVGLFGAWPWHDLRRLRFRAIERRPGRPGVWREFAVMLAVTAVVWFFGVEPVIHDLVKHDGILNPEPEPRVLR